MRQSDPKVMRIATTALMDACTAKEIARVASVADEVTAPAGTKLCHQGGAAHHCYLVLDGEVEVVVDGRVVSVVGAGEIVGELSLLDHGTRSATLLARTPVRLAAINGGDLDSLMSLPGVRRGVLRQITDRFRALDICIAAG